MRNSVARKALIPSLASVLILSALIVGPAAAAQTAAVSAPGRVYVTSHHPDGQAFCTLATPEFRDNLEQQAIRLARQRSSSPGTDRLDRLEPDEAFELTLDGFTPEAEAAYRRAIEIWAEVLDVQVPIRVMGSFEAQGPNTLGSGGPFEFIRDFPGAPQPGVFYVAALADQLAGVDNTPGSASDVVTSFNSTFSDFYFGLDANPPAGQFDFVSVVVHELGHGLGFTDSSCVTPESSPCDAIENGHGAFGLGATNLPVILDTFIQTGPGGRIIDLVNPSAELGAALVGGDLHFSGPGAIEANDGIRPKLWAPPTFDPGSSIAHLDELVFPGFRDDGVMTPFINAQETFHVIGTVTAALFEDMGWPVTTERILHFAQFGNGAGFSSAVVVVNPSETLRASGSVDFFDEAGNALAADAFLNGGSEFDLAPRASRTFATSGAGALVLGSAVVRSDRPVAGVLRFRIDVGGLGIAGVGAGLVAQRVIAPVRREGSVSTGIAIRNVNADDVNVTLRLLHENGSAAAAPVAIVIAGNARISQFAEEIFGQANVPVGFRGSLTAEVDGEGQIAVIALELGGPGEFATLPVAPLR